MLNVNPHKTNVILGKKTIKLAGKDTIQDTLNGLKFDISAQSFYQVNPQQTEKLYQLAIENAELTGKETVIDAYCGIGTISLNMAKFAKKVYGVEIVPEAIEIFKKRMDTHVENVYHFLDYLGSEDCAHLRDILIKTTRYMEENK